MQEFIIQQVRSFGLLALRWVMRHKSTTAIAILILYILFWPKSVPSQRAESNPLPMNSGLHQRDASLPASTRPAIQQQFAGDLPLYAPDQEGADPKWSLPAELKGQNLQSLAHQVDKLYQDIPATAQMEQQCNEGIANLIDTKTVGLYWTRVTGKGFRDTNLPLDWYQVVKNNNSILDNSAMLAEILTNQAVQMAITMRLSSVQVRIIGGNVLIGDILFLRAAQDYIDQRRPYFEKLLPLVQSVQERTRREFSSELNQN
jgi:hypothetical protein